MYRGRHRKYNNRTAEIDGIKFDSWKEARRYRELELLQAAGVISGLERQKKFDLIPVQREPSKGKKKGRVIERECSYIADFVYRDENDNLIVEDTKGVKTKDYIIKRKLMLYMKGIRIREV